MSDQAESKVRKNVFVSPETLKQADELARAECRNSFSNVIEALIDREHRRVFGPQQDNVTVVNGNAKAA